MKKFLFMTLAAAALMGCAKEQILTQDREAIAFTNAFVDNATKAADASFNSSNLPTSFVVYGTTTGDHDNATPVTVFNGVEVKYENDAWDYSNDYTQYWINNNTYAFAAVVNGVISDDKKISYTADYTGGDTKDLLYAVSKYGQYVKGRSNASVEFTFQHLLAKAHFTVKNTIATNTADNMYTYRVSGIKITNAYTSGTYDITKYNVSDADAWDESTTTTGEVSFGNLTSVIGKEGTTDEATSEHARLLVPAEYTALNIKCTIETLLNGSVVDVENYENETSITFKEGHAYNFVISKGNPGEKIEFTIDPVITGWNTATGGTL